MGEKQTRNKDTMRSMNIPEAKPSLEDKGISADTLPYYNMALPLPVIPLLPLM